MKRQTPRHPKMLDLAARLDIRLYEAVGIMEMLWHFTARYAPQGNVGKHTNATIARELDWPDAAEMLIDALVQTGWVEAVEDPEVRLGIHDWCDHADDTCDQYLADRGLMYWNGKPPRRKPRKNGKKPRESSGHSRTTTNKHVHARTSTSSQSQSQNQNQNSPHTPQGADERDDSSESPEGDAVYAILQQSEQLRAMTYAQDRTVRQCFGAYPGRVPYKKLAEDLVEEMELWTEPVANPALLWRKRIQRYVDQESDEKSGGPVESAPYVPLSERAG